MGNASFLLVFLQFWGRTCRLKILLVQPLQLVKVESMFFQLAVVLSQRVFNARISIRKKKYTWSSQVF